MSSHVLAVGEALVDEVYRPDGSSGQYPGGSVANVALTLGRLGRRVRLATWIGSDTYGALVRNWLTESNIELVEGSEGAARTSVSIAQLDAQGSAAYNFDLIWDVPEATGVSAETLAVHSGSIAALVEPGAALVRSLLTGARSTSTVTYDPNIRPAIMGAADNVRPHVETLVSLCDVVKVSEEDLGWLYPGMDPVDVARTWQDETPAVVVVTLGADGAVAVSDVDVVAVEAPKVEVVDTVGAGDALMGAFIDGLWEHRLLGAHHRGALNAIDPVTLRRILTRSCEIAAMTVSRAGTNPPRRMEIGP